MWKNRDNSQRKNKMKQIQKGSENTDERKDATNAEALFPSSIFLGSAAFWPIRSVTMPMVPLWSPSLFELCCF